MTERHLHLKAKARIIRPLFAALGVCILACSLSCSRKDDSGRVSRQSISFDRSSVDIHPLFRVRQQVDLETTRNSLVSFPFDMCINGGKVFIASRASTIKVFTLKGEFVRTIGGLGDGPGEYRWIVALFNVGSDRIGVYDSNNLRLSVYTTDGEYLWGKRFALPGVVSIRSIEYNDGRFYFHVPATQKRPFYLTITDSSLNVIHECVPASFEYKGYFYFNLFHGSIVIDASRGKAYETNCFSYKPTEVDLKTWQTREINLPKPAFFRPIPPYYDDINSRIERATNSFRQGTDTFKSFLLQDRYLVAEFLDQHGSAVVDPLFVVLDLSTGRSYTASDNRAIPNYSDGKYLYDLFYSGRSPTSEEDDYVRNPRLIVYELIEPPQK